MFEDIVDKVFANQLYLTIAAILAGVMLFSLMKKLFKLLLIAVLLVILGAAYISYTSDDPVGATKDLLEKGKETIDDLQDRKDDLKDMLDQVQ